VNIYFVEKGTILNKTLLPLGVISLFLSKQIGGEMSNKKGGRL
jgi:hypothetical protein